MPPFDKEDLPMSEEIANHSEESQEIERDADTEALYESFGMPKQVEKKDIEFPKMEEPQTEEEEPPTIEEPESVETEPSEKRTIKVKYLGEEKDVPEDEAPTWIQKGMNHDRLQEKLSEQEKALDRAAKLQGFKDHADLLSNLDRLEQEREQKQRDEFDQLKQKIVDDLVYNGVDEQSAREYAENNPLVQQAREALQEKETIRQEQEKAQAEQQKSASWNELYQAYPELAKSFKEDGSAEWYTPDMHVLIEQGYKPIHAYQLTNADKIQTQTKKATEQRLIKEQQLGVRSAAAGQTPALESEATLSSAQMALAEEFGVSVKGVQRQQQLLKNRR